MVGNRGLGGFTALLLGSVGITVAACAPSSVVVVRGPQAHPEGPVVVGVDGSPRGAAALVTAFQEASRRGVGVMVVHAWTFPLHLEAVDDGYEALYAEGRRAGQELLDKSVAEATASFPHVEVELRLGDRSSAAELVAASDDAQLVVVGTRGLGGLRGALLGSTTHALLHHAACPVFVQHAG
ncbi:MAG: UspA protein [Frankiales bacterium]|nr:UspA protein [Frankiales bacterium]